MSWQIINESCNINFKQDGVSHRTLPKEQVVLEIVLAGEPLNDSGIDCVFVRYEGKYAMELPYTQTTIGVTSYASAELLRAAIETLCDTNPCYTTVPPGSQDLQSVTDQGNITTNNMQVNDGNGVTATLTTNGLVIADGSAIPPVDISNSGVTVSDGATPKVIIEDGGVSIGTGVAPTVALDVVGSAKIIASGVGDIDIYTDNNVRIGESGNTQIRISGSNDEGTIEYRSSTHKFYELSGPNKVVQIDANGLLVDNIGELTPGAGVKINGVKVYRAILTQSGTSAPVANVLENTLGEVPTWVYTAAGQYTLTTVANVFNANKVFCSNQGQAYFNINSGSAWGLGGFRTTDTAFLLQTIDNGSVSPADDLIGATPSGFISIEILVYP